VTESLRSSTSKVDEALQTSAPEALKAPGVLMPDSTYSANTGESKAQSNVEHLVSEPVRFLELLRPNGPWVLTAISTDGDIIGKTARTAAEVDAFVNEYNGKRNLYYSVNPTTGAVFKKAAKTDIAAIEYSLADLDPASGETSEAAKTRYLGQLNGTFEPSPSAVVDSGNGIQCLWKLAQPIILGEPVKGIDGKLAFSPEDQAKIKDAEDRTAAIMVRLGAKAGTQNIDRILRLPGTTNLPNARKVREGRVPCPTKLISFNGSSYSLELFPLPEKEEPSGPGSPADGGHHEKYAEVTDKLERVIREGDKSGFETRSHAMWWAINEMMRRGYFDAAIVSTLHDRKNAISAHILEQNNPRAYAERQVAEAREKFKATSDAKGRPLPESQWFGEKPLELPPALIRGVFPRTGVATIGGQSGGGKSFHAIHLGLCLIPNCQQTSYIDKYRIKRHGGVLYLVLEGKAAFPMRLAAAYNNMMEEQMKFGERLKIPFCWNTYSPSLFSEGPEALLKIVNRDAAKMRKDYGVDMVAFMIDTMGLAAIFKNENDAAQVQKVICDLGRMSEETGALAVDVDHYGKEQGSGLRGSSAKRAGADTVFTCLVDRDDKNDKATNHRLWFEKIRDGEEGREVPYRLKQVPVGHNDDGELETTCVIQWELNRPLPKRKARVSKKFKTSVPLDMAIQEVGLPADLEVLRTSFYKHHGGKSHAANAAWNRAVEEAGMELIDGKICRPGE
jgi:AAA domain